jgi:hypothetical protein
MLTTGVAAMCSVRVQMCRLRPDDRAAAVLRVRASRRSAAHLFHPQPSRRNDVSLVTSTLTRRLWKDVHTLRTRVDISQLLSDATEELAVEG